MDKKQKGELICKYLAIKAKALANEVKFTKIEKMFQSSTSFVNLLETMENIVNQKEYIYSFFEGEPTPIKSINISFPESIDEIVLFDEFKNYEFLKEIEPGETPFIFVRGTKENIKEIFSTSKDNSISVVGSRRTPKIYSQGIDERIPENKVVVSGLSAGADLLGHRVAIEKNMKIVIFPGLDITENPAFKKMDIGNYALTSGLILSSVVPGVPTDVPEDMVKRNYQMAKVVSETYALYFGPKSGVLGHLRYVAIDDKPIYVPANIMRDVVSILEDKEIIDHSEVK